MYLVSIVKLHGETLFISRYSTQVTSQPKSLPLSYQSRGQGEGVSQKGWGGNSKESDLEERKWGKRKSRAEISQRPNCRLPLSENATPSPGTKKNWVWW